MSKLFDAVKEKHDGKGRVVFVCKDANGLYVYKPGTGFRSKHYTEGEELDSCFERQAICNHPNAFYEAHELPAENEEYPEVEEKKI